MSKYAAVYYPHTSMRSPELLKNSLLLWDNVDCIVPHSRFSLTEGIDIRYAESAEILLRRRVPQFTEMDKVDKLIDELFMNGTPAWISELTINDQMDTRRRGRTLNLNSEYLMYPQKLLSKTWDKLSKLEVARFACLYSDWAVPPPLGLLLMSELAKACAGETQHIITDRPQAYSCIFSAMTFSLGGRIVNSNEIDLVSSTIDRLMTISVRVANISKLPYKRILDLRKRESKENTNDLKNLRHKYIDEITKYSQQFVQPHLSYTDRKELTRQCSTKLESDFRELKKELGMAATDLLFSKEVGVAVLAFAGALSSPLALGVALSAAVKSIGVGALIGDSVKYLRARKKAINSHSMSWLFLAGRPNLHRNYYDR